VVEQKSEDREPAGPAAIDSRDEIPPAETRPADLSLRGVTKSFPDVLANDGIDLDVSRGEVHAILGENGAGKSTLMKILYGYYHPDAGTISVRGVPIQIHSPHEGRKHGIGMVFQHFMLVPALTVIENVALALQNLPFVLPLSALERQIRELSERYRFNIDPRARVRDLSIGERQKVEIVKLLMAKAEFLIFDEPTSVLAPHEVDELMGIFRQLRQDGLAVLFITHKLREVLAVADRITVLRRGRVVATMPAADTSEAALVKLLLGSGAEAAERLASRTALPASPPELCPPSHPGNGQKPGVPALEILNAEVPDPAGRMHLRDITLSIYAGEVVGVAAVSGNGQRELGELVLGLHHHASGSMRVFGIEAQRWSPARALNRGVGCVPEDPLRLGTVPMMSVLENMILPERKRYAGWGGFSVRWNVAREHIDQALQHFGLRTPPLGARISGLSGGNVQRVVLARELARRPRLLVGFYPTRGMDVPSASAARDLLRTHRAAGAAILLVSEDLDELFELSDRLIVMHRGKIVGTFRPDETNPHAVGILMTGAGSGRADRHGATAGASDG
jgi:simple sugar transport system ATP-binding protein